MKNIEWKTNGLFKADANRCYEEIVDIGDEATPQEIVNAAEDPNSELHKCFTWDNNKAANKWRKQEARILVTNLVVRYEQSEGKSEKLRVIVHNDSGKYERVERVFKRPDAYTNLLNRARQELKFFKSKYNQVKELQEIMELIDW